MLQNLQNYMFGSNRGHRKKTYFGRESNWMLYISRVPWRCMALEINIPLQLLNDLRLLLV